MAVRRLGDYEKKLLDKLMAPHMEVLDNRKESLRCKYRNDMDDDSIAELARKHISPDVNKVQVKRYRQRAWGRLYEKQPTPVTMADDPNHSRQDRTDQRVLKLEAKIQNLGNLYHHLNDLYTDLDKRHRRLWGSTQDIAQRITKLEQEWYGTSPSSNIQYFPKPAE